MAAGTGAPATSERIEGMDRLSFRHSGRHHAGRGALRRRGPPVGRGAGRGRDRRCATATSTTANWASRAAMFDPPNGAFLVARRGDAAGPPLGGVGVRAIGPGVGEVRRLWVDPELAGAGHRPGPHGRARGRRPRPRPHCAASRPRATASPRRWRSTSPPAGSGRVGDDGRPCRRGHPLHQEARRRDRDETRPSSSICEIEPATTPDLTRVRHQIGVLSPVATTFLIPDNHIGRATVSSVAVAHEVQQMGGRSIACLNARDRNLLGFRRDLLTAAAYGVDQFLFVYGDEPLGRRAHQRAEGADHAARGARLRPAGPVGDGGSARCASAPPAGCGPCRPGSRRPTSSSCRSASRSTTCWPGGPRSRSTSPSTPGSS